MAIPTCAIIIPLFNKQKQILRALESVVCQQKIPFNEIIIVNDCSTDDSVMIVERFISDHPESAVQLIHHQRNSGPGAARNTGLGALKSDFACFLDADDFLTPTASEELHHVLSKSGEKLGLLIFGVKEQGSGAIRPSFRHLQQKKFAQTVDANILKLNDWASAMVSEPLFCSGGNALIRRYLTKCHFDPTLRNFEDWDFYFRVCQEACESGLDILVSNHLGLIYTDEDELSLSRAAVISPSLQNPPSFISNIQIPLKVRKFTVGIWLCHVTQRSGWCSGLNFINRALKETGDAQPPLKHFIAAILLLLLGHRCWSRLSRMRKHLRYV